MRKLFFIFLFSIFALKINAFTIGQEFTYSKDFWQESAKISVPVSYAFNVGLDFDLTEHDDIDHHIYNFALPLMLRTDTFGLFFRPFITPDNANNASAWGAKLYATINIKDDEIEQTTAYSFLSVGFASQDAYVFKTGQTAQKEDFNQIVYEGGVLFDYFGIYFFEVGGNIFQYLSGINSVESVGGVLEQQNIASLDSLDYTLALPKGSAGLKIRWNSQESSSENSVSYRFIEFHDKGASAHHSVQISSNIFVGDRFIVGLAYNHIFISSQKDKDIFKAALSLKL